MLWIIGFSLFLIDCLCVVLVVWVFVYWCLVLFFSIVICVIVLVLFVVECSYFLEFGRLSCGLLYFDVSWVMDCLRTLHFDDLWCFGVLCTWFWVVCYFLFWVVYFSWLRLEFVCKCFVCFIVCLFLGWLGGLYFCVLLFRLFVFEFLICVLMGYL